VPDGGDAGQETLVEPPVPGEPPEPVEPPWPAAPDVPVVVAVAVVLVVELPPAPAVLDVVELPPAPPVPDVVVSPFVSSPPQYKAASESAIAPAQGPMPILVRMVPSGVNPRASF